MFNSSARRNCRYMIYCAILEHTFGSQPVQSHSSKACLRLSFALSTNHQDHFIVCTFAPAPVRMAPDQGSKPEKYSTNCSLEIWHKSLEKYCKPSSAQHMHWVNCLKDNVASVIYTNASFPFILWITTFWKQQRKLHLAPARYGTVVVHIHCRCALTSAKNAHLNQ